MDTAWRPFIPSGHTKFSWGRRKPAPKKSSDAKNSGQVKTKAVAQGKIAIMGPPKSNTPKVPVEGKRNILITSALPYVNNVPHLGNLIGCVLSADVYSRFCRLRGHNSIYVCGTDEYGTATERKARQLKMSPRQICDKYHKIHKDVYDWFNIDFDAWGRTTSPHQTPIAQGIFHDVDEAKRISEKVTEQLYCQDCKMFLADRYVEGTCPNCGSEGARGDQCDTCGTTYESHELVNPKCTLCHKTPIKKETKHLYLNLDDLSPKLRQFIDRSAEEGGWSDNSKRVTEGWMKEGLLPRCITRDLSWGTPVPKDGFRNKVFYVWFDAPIGYISITAAYTKDWKKWWQNPGNVELAQFMGKDNIPFHTVVFPSTLLGTGKPWTLLHRISTTEYLNYEDSKFSKSRGTGVFGDTAQSTGISPAVYRYYLMCNRPETGDTFFKWEDLVAKNNNELLKNLGNYINRSLSFVHKYFEGKSPTAGTLDEQDTKLIEAVNEAVGRYIDHMELCHMREGLKSMMDVSRLGNGYIQATKPWVLMKSADTKARGATVINLGLSIAYLLTALVHPFMPTTATNILHQLNMPFPTTLLNTPETKADMKHTFNFTANLVPSGHQLGTAALLFTAIPKEKIAEWKAQFGGEAYQQSLKKGPPFPLYLSVGEVIQVDPHPTTPDKSFVLQVKMIPGELPVETKEDKEAKASAAAKEASSQGKTGKSRRKGKKAAKDKSTAPELLPTRTIVSGLVGQYTPEQLLGKKVVVCVNSAQRPIQGVLSQGLVLTAITKIDGKKVFRLLTVDKPCGTLILPEGYSYDHKPSINAKKVFSKLKMRTGPNGEAASKKEGVWKADGVVITSDDTLVNAAIA